VTNLAVAETFGIPYVPFSTGESSKQ